MKKCPYCAEQIQIDAKICPHCRKEQSPAAVMGDSLKKAGCSIMQFQISLILLIPFGLALWCLISGLFKK